MTESEQVVRDAYVAAIVTGLITKEGLPAELGMDEFTKRVFELANRLMAARSEILPPDSFERERFRT